MPTRHHHPANSALSALLVLAAIPAFAAMDITGTVMDKLDRPIPGAKVCIQATTYCNDTDPAGKFHVTGSAAIGDRAPGKSPFTLEFRGGRISLFSPAAMRARVEWFDAQGRPSAPALSISLAGGRNDLWLPSAGGRDGIRFLRIATADASMTWKTLLVAGAPAGEGSAAPMSAMALSKTSAASGSLTVTKAGYKPLTYRPLDDNEKDVALFLTATDDAGVPFSGAVTVNVVSIDRTLKRIITESTDTYCDDNDSLVAETYRDTNFYAIRDGKMYMWLKGDCYGAVHTGGSADIVGTWTMVESWTELPADLKEPGCYVDSSEEGGTMGDGVTGTIKIEETKLVSDYSTEFCPGDLYVPLLALFIMGDSGVSMTKNTCMQADFKNEKNETAALKFSKSGDSLGIEFSFGTKVCKTSQDFAFNSVPTVCPEPSTMPQFFQCVMTSGFSAPLFPGGGGLEKASAGQSRDLPSPWPMSMERRGF